MYYEELISHLYHLKILAHLDQYKTTASKYFENIRQAHKAQTELDILEGDNDYHKIYRDELIEKAYNKALEIHKKTTLLEIERLLNKAGFEKPLFGSLAITFENLLNTLQKTEYKELKDYIFGKEWFKKQIKNAKSKQQIVLQYKELLQASINDDFTQYLSLLQAFQLSLEGSLDTRVKTLSEALRRTEKNDRTSHIKEVYTNLQQRIIQSNYILVGTTLKSSKIELVNLASLIQWFTKTNGLNFNSFEVDKEQILRYFSDLYFVNYIQENYATAIENVDLNPDEVFNIIQSRNELNKIIYPDNIETFKGIEKQLLNEGFFNKKGTWVADKQDLIGFILQCELKGYLKIKLNSNHRLIVRRFFEERYHIDIVKIFQPNQINKLEHLSAQFYWIKKPVEPGDTVLLEVAYEWKKGTASCFKVRAVDSESGKIVAIGSLKSKIIEEL